MPLTDTVLRKAKPADKPYRMTDGDGLYVIVQPTGAIWWRFDYRINDTRKTISMGTYPDVPLIVARRRRDDARQKVAAGIDPVEVTRQEKQAKDHTFGKLVDCYIQHLRDLKRSEATIAKNEWLLVDLAATLHSKPTVEIKAADILPVLKKLEA